MERRQTPGTSKSDVGTDAERVALEHLQDHGLELICRNYRCRLGELDLVMREDQTLIVVEVRLRKPSRFGNGVTSIDAFKRMRIVRTTQHLLMTHRALANLRIRFDVVALEPPPKARIEWIRAAFDAE